MPDPKAATESEPAPDAHLARLDDEEELLDRCARCMRLGGSCREEREDFIEPLRNAA